MKLKNDIKKEREEDKNLSTMPDINERKHMPRGHPP